MSHPGELVGWGLVEKRIDSFALICYQIRFASLRGQGPSAICGSRQARSSLISFTLAPVKGSPDLFPEVVSQERQQND
jgi:hypothetical protein